MIISSQILMFCDWILYHSSLLACCVCHDVVFPQSPKAKDQMSEVNDTFTVRGILKVDVSELKQVLCGCCLYHYGPIDMNAQRLARTPKPCLDSSVMRNETTAISCHVKARGNERTWERVWGEVHKFFWTQNETNCKVFCMSHFFFKKRAFFWSSNLFFLPTVPYSCSAEVHLPWVTSWAALI